jgi:CRISPR-associated protein Cas6
MYSSEFGATACLRITVTPSMALSPDGAVARVLETREDAWLHQLDQVGLHLLRGAYDRRGRLLLGPRARFGLRLPAALIPKVLALAGKRLLVGDDSLRVGVPHVQALRPASVLAARVVTTRNGQDDRRFDREIARQLGGLGIAASAVRGRRRVFRAKVAQSDNDRASSPTIKTMALQY